MSSPPIVAKDNVNPVTKPKPKEITSFSPTGKTTTSSSMNTLCFSPQPTHKTSLQMQSSEKNVMNK